MKISTHDVLCVLHIQSHRDLVNPSGHQCDGMKVMFPNLSRGCKMHFVHSNLELTLSPQGYN